MELKEQVCSLKFAKKLKKLGVNHKSLFWWSRAKRGYWHVEYGACVEINEMTDIPAFTVAELGGMMQNYRLNISRIFWDAKEADARAKLLIHLLESGLVKAEKLP